MRALDVGGTAGTARLRSRPARDTLACFGMNEVIASLVA